MDWSGLTFPVELNQIAIFEKKNPEISINVFGFAKDVYPLRISKKNKKRAKRAGNADCQSAPDFGWKKKTFLRDQEFEPVALKSSDKT